MLSNSFKTRRIHADLYGVDLNFDYRHCPSLGKKDRLQQTYCKCEGMSVQLYFLASYRQIPRPAGQMPGGVNWRKLYLDRSYDRSYDRTLFILSEPDGSMDRVHRPYGDPSAELTDSNR